MQHHTLKQHWSLTPNAFEALLSWLDQGQTSEGQTYLEIRRRLVAYFDRKNCREPEHLADETLNRVARKLGELGAIDTEAPAKYCYVTARFVFLENLRVRTKEQQLRAEILLESSSHSEDEGRNEIQGRRMDCLRQCASKLDRASRDLILRYYIGEEKMKIDNRRAMARALAITPNALSIRACRIREKLEICVRACVAPHETNP